MVGRIPRGLLDTAREHDLQHARAPVRSRARGYGLLPPPAVIISPMANPSCGNGCGCPDCVERVLAEVTRALATLPLKPRGRVLSSAGAANLEDWRASNAAAEQEYASTPEGARRHFQRQQLRDQIASRLTTEEWTALESYLRSDGNAALDIAIIIEQGKLESLADAMRQHTATYKSGSVGRFIGLLCRALANSHLDADDAHGHVMAALAFNPETAS